MKPEKATGPSEVNVEMIVASGEIGVKVMMDLYQRVLDGRGMSDECKNSVIVPIFKGKGDVIICGSYRGVKLLELAMKMVERVLERRIRALINLNKKQFGFMPGKGTVDAVFIVIGMQEEYQRNDKKLYLCFIDKEKGFVRIPRKVMEWAMRKEGLLEVMIRAVMSLYNDAKTRLKVGSAYLEEFEVKVCVHQGSLLSPLLLAIVVNLIAENAKRGVVNKLQCALTHDRPCSHERKHAKLKGKILELERCTVKKGFEGQHQKNKSDGKRVKRRTVQKQDRSMWSLWEESHR